MNETLKHVMCAFMRGIGCSQNLQNFDGQAILENEIAKMLDL